MKKSTIFVFSLIFKLSMAFSVVKLDECFLIHYGNSNAPLKVTEYFSFSCPHCLKLFHEFPKIKEEFIDKGLIYFTFHPVPKEITTLMSLHCFKILNDKEKQVFLEAMLEYLENNPDDNLEICRVMQEFLVCLHKPKLPLDDHEYLKESPIMQKSFLFISQDEQINALPTVEVNELLFLKDIPDYAFFSEVVKAVIGEQK